VLVWPRVLLRGLSAIPKQLPGSLPEHAVANLSHVSLYGFMFVMPGTGMAMGYYGGKGVPFYGLFTIPGKTEGRTKEDGAFAGQMFKWHKWAGGWLWYLVPLHVAGAVQHSLRGHTIFTRINPFATR
jgi:cytochrome b561